MGLPFLSVGRQPAPLSGSVWSVCWISGLFRIRVMLCQTHFITEEVHLWAEDRGIHIFKADNHLSVGVAQLKHNLEMVFYEHRVLSSRTQYTV